jgi:PAS domain-containing protein
MRYLHQALRVRNGRNKEIPSMTTPATNDDLQAEIQRLRRQVAQLEAQIATPSQSATHDSHWFNYVSDAVFITDLNWQIQQWNRAAEQIYGWPRSVAIGRSIWDVIPVMAYFHDQSDTHVRTTLRQ